MEVGSNPPGLQLPLKLNRKAVVVRLNLTTRCDGSCFEY